MPFVFQIWHRGYENQMRRMPNTPSYCQIRPVSVSIQYIPGTPHPQRALLKLRLSQSRDGKKL